MINILELYNKFCKGQQDSTQFNREIQLHHEVILQWESYKDIVDPFMLTLDFSPEALKSVLAQIDRSEVLRVKAQQYFFFEYQSKFNELYVFRFN